MRPTIAAGIVCYNEIEWIKACINGALLFADEVIITDGLYIPNRGTDQADTRLSETVMHPSDGTWELLQEMAEQNERICLLGLPEGMPIDAEIQVRDMQLQFCTADYFLIVDADEVWTKSAAGKLEKALIEDDGKTDNWYLTNKLYWHTPQFYFDTKHMRLFKNDRERHFTGINEIEPHEGERILDVGFHHYGYIDPPKVLFKMRQRYTKGVYQGCGEWWWKEIFMNFDIGKDWWMSALKLTNKNSGTLHPWGKIHPGFAADEWVLKRSDFPEHPRDMVFYFKNRGFDLSKIDFVS